MVAKALALECMRAAKAQDRGCYVFAFAGPQEVRAASWRLLRASLTALCLVWVSESLCAHFSCVVSRQGMSWQGSPADLPPWPVHPSAVDSRRLTAPPLTPRPLLMPPTPMLLPRCGSWS